MAEYMENFDVSVNDVSVKNLSDDNEAVMSGSWKLYKVNG
jgi:hypothetical protein